MGYRSLTRFYSIYADYKEVLRLSGGPSPMFQPRRKKVKGYQRVKK